MNDSMPIIIAVGVPLVLIFLVWLFYRSFRTHTPDEVKQMRLLHDEINAAGVRTDAVVKKINRIVSGGSGLVVSTYADMVLEVTLPDGKKYEVSENVFGYDKRFSFNLAFTSYVGKVGARIPVIVHPTEHQALLIDEERLMSMATEK
jgi:hypothetical protein